MKKFSVLLVVVYLFFGYSKNLFAQSVLNPNDPIVEYDSENPPVQPPYGQIGKWVRTKSLSWNSDSYKCYIYNGSNFRLKFPKSYNPTANDGKKYPIALVFHGGGEAGPIYDNETHLYHGGLEYMNAVDDGRYDGYVLFMQSQGFWGTTSYLRILDIINYMILNNKLDPFCISANGLSSGGQASWDMVLNYPNYTTASLPMSNISIGYKESATVNKVKFTPMWDFQGALDGSPSPSTAQQVNAAMVAAGANYKYSEYADVGHNTWDSAFADTDFFPFMKRSYASNPYVLYGRTGFCDSTNLNLTVGLPPGYDSYQWRKNGVVINGATSNSITVTSLGTYDAKVLRGTLWSEWSRIPVVIRITPPTQTPPITVAGLMSNVLVAADGKKYVNLQVPDNGYTSYKWKKVGSDSVIGTQRIFTATQPGQYIAAVTEKYGCSSVYSPPFAVIDAKGFNVPDAASKLTPVSLSSTEIQLSWENNPHPVNNETYFEIYRAAGQDGYYNFVGKVATDVLTFKDTKLSAGITYFYKVRAVNENGAAPLSNIISTSTQADKTLPTAPGNLKVLYSTNNSIKIQWNSSTDNVGVKNYQVYINGVNSYSTTDTSIIASSLQQGSNYSFYVKAVDSSNNFSTQSNIVSSPAILKGLIYNYYEGYFLTVPDFNTLAPVYSGVSPNTNVNYSRRQTQYGFLWQGYLNVPVTGNFRIGITSDDGTLLWFNTYDPSIPPFINNDHLSTIKTKYGAINLNKGLVRITIAYFQNKNATGVQLSWANFAYFGDSLYHPIADSFFAGGYTPADVAPKAPGNITATTQSYDQIKIKWNDSSSNETGFQVYRSLKQTGTYTIIYTSAPNVKQYTDTGLISNLTYYYKVNAVNDFGTSAYTLVASAKTSKLTNPKPPTSVKAVALSSSSVNITWTDVDSTEINYQVLRSASDSSNFKPAALLPANSTSYTDSELYGNTFYFYKVITVGVASNSIDKPAVKVITGNNSPVINNKFTQKAVPYGAQTTIAISATDPDGDVLTFTGKNLPSFLSIVSTGNNSANLVFNPSSAQQGTYPGVKIIVRDGATGVDSSLFDLTVNNNYYPVLDSIAAYTMTESETLSIPVNSTDANAGDNLNISVSGAPNNYSLVPVSNGKANLVLKPNYGASGSYLIQVTVSDGNGGSVSRQFSLYVNDKDPSQNIYVRFKDIDAMGLPWNDVTGVTTNNFKDDQSRPTTVGLNLQTSWFATWHEGPSTGNNSGIYPDNVLKDYYYIGTFGGPNSISPKITGLDTSRLYNISFYAGSVWSGAVNNGNTDFTIGSQTISLAVQNNTKNTADFSSIKPASDGSITFTMAKGASAPAGYLNAIVIKSLYTDSLKPATPHYLVALNAPVKGVQLTWNDMAYNETAYKVFRATNQAGPYTVLTSTLQFNTTSFLDTTVAGGTQYYYFVKATNAAGNSDSSNIAAVLTKDKLPVISPIANVLIKNNQQQTVNVTANDDATDHVTLTATNLPSFVTFTDNGNGTGSFSIVPTSGITGTFEDITLQATDQSDSSTTASFNITITDQNINSVYVNFSTGTLASSPWNNFTQYPVANSTISNLVDDNNTTTSISLKIMNGFQGNFNTGMQPGNNKGVYPEVVMRTGLYEGASKTDSIQLSGLAKNKKYNLIFFNSHDDGLKGTTNFTVSGQTVTLNATHNINTTAQVNGILADANGQVVIKVAKASGADYAYFNSLVIQSYDSAQKLLAPSDLRIVGITKNTVKLQWADRSFDETGFEIWRTSDTINPTYTLVKTLGANSTVYTDAGLSSGRTYYYTVRSINSSAQSAYCNPAAVTTYSQALYINFTFTTIAPAPWNNTQALPQPGLVWNGFIDDGRAPSGIGLKELGSFAGLYGPGMNTGNNSGIYPDAVLANAYGLFTGESSSVKLTGLNSSKKYDLTFSASSQTGGDLNTVYTVNGKKVILNAALNTDGAVTMYSVTADVNGEIIISIAPNSATSVYGLLGSLIVQEYAPSTRTIPAPPSLLHKTGIALNNNEQSLKQASSAYNKNKIAAYPNPFSGSLKFSVHLVAEDNLQAALYNINGKLVLQKNLGNVLKGDYNFSIIPDRNVTPGVYILKITGMRSGFNESLKVLKQ